MTDRDHFAAAALTGLIEWKRGDETTSSSNDLARWAYGLADAMLRERERVTEPMPKEKRAEVSDRPQPVKDGDSDSPKPIGIDPAAYEGDIVSRLRHWRGLHLAHNGELFEAAAAEIERLRTIMYRVVDGDCTVAIQNGTFYADDEPLFAVPHTPPMQTTPGECSTQGEGTSEPVAWAVVSDSKEEIDCEFIYPDEATAGDVALDSNGGVVPLYRSPQPTLTDAERASLTRAIETLEGVEYMEAFSTENDATAAATLRGLLERTK